MKKLLIITALPCLLSANIALAFSDISDSHPYFTALSYLEKKSVINGYPDGSFQAYKPINRAELLKILLENSKIKISEPTEDCFSDVQPGLWYSKYICSAKTAGVVEGYDTGKFKPDKAINKVEALKIMAIVYNWNLDEATNQALYYDTPSEHWYAPYIKYAKLKNYLEETGTLFKPGDEISRANISNVLYKHLARIEIGHDKFYDSTEVYIKTKYGIESTNSTTQISPQNIRLELTWQNPAYDLDLHLIKPLIIEEGDNEVLSSEHLSFLIPFSEDSTAFFSFEEQKETLRITKLIEGNYQFYVALYSNQTSMTSAKPLLKLFSNDQLLKTYDLEQQILSLPQAVQSNPIKKWNLFQIDNLGDINAF